MPRISNKVLVALSGGVDSSVAAALLLKEGYDVTGAFMKQWSETAMHLPLGKGGIAGACSWKRDRQDALRVAAKLSIPLITLDFAKEYKERVMEYMFKEYEAGRTPNPDVLCNKQIKFGVWLEKARAMGFPKLATGHYANIKTLKLKNIKTFHLLEAKDKDKDQTYFLHQLNQKQLVHTLFPIGKYLKREVRSLARRFHLPTAERAESMGICFVGEVPMKQFLSQRIAPRPGNIVTSVGDIIGTHDGLAFYTIGQRHGWGGAGGVKSLNNKPMYVVDKNLDTNELVVGYEDDPRLFKKMIRVAAVNWIRQTPSFPLECEVRLRHRQKMQRAKCQIMNNELWLEFDTLQRAVTPGQFAVFYLQGECLGGGVVE